MRPVKSPQARARWKNLNTRLNDSHNVDKTTVLNKQLEDLRLAYERGHLYNHLQYNSFILWEEYQNQRQGET